MSRFSVPSAQQLSACSVLVIAALGLVLPGVEAAGTPRTEGTCEGCIPEGKMHAYLPLRIGGKERQGRNLREKPVFSSSCLDPDKLTVFTLP